MSLEMLEGLSTDPHSRDPVGEPLKTCYAEKNLSIFNYGHEPVSVKTR
jgi:hypothetical protein